MNPSIRVGIPVERRAMMRLRRLLLVVVLMATIPLAALAGEAPSKDRVVTVEEFAVMLSAAKARAGGPALEVALTADYLVKAGVQIGNPGLPLSEGKLVEILDRFGVKARTSAPDRAVTLGKAEAALVLASSSLTTAAASSPQTEISECVNNCILNERNHGQCLLCCRECPENLTSRGCSRLCKEEPVSPGEPEP
jgi:hypothetical protein